MSAREICWRLRGKLTDAMDRGLMPLRRARARPDLEAAQEVLRAARGQVVAPHLPAAGDPTAVDVPLWVSELASRADRICANRITLFDLEDHDLGLQIDWNYEYKALVAAPMTFAPAIDYRDRAVTGDCKFIWELNRHHHLVTLGRAYRLTGQRAYAATVARHLDAWMTQCPYGLGMNWRSPLELAIRLINWVWALEFIRPAGVLDAETAGRLLLNIEFHLDQICRRYSRFSSANNHRIGEAAGVFIATTYLPDLPRSARRQAESRRILEEEIVLQTHPDGGNREQAFGYHLFVTEFFLLAGLAARRSGEDFTPAYWRRLEAMIAFIHALLEGGNPPMYGDCDDGYVLDLGGRHKAAELTAAGSVLFDRSDWRRHAGAFSETVFWLFGCTQRPRHESAATAGTLCSRAFPDTGLYLLQYEGADSSERMSLTFNCGELGMGAIAAHGHADALSFTLRALGEDILIDPGTYDYFSTDHWREYFRSTRAHNTVVVDGVDQSEPLGRFLWGRRAAARCLLWEPAPDGGTVAGEHDGYGALPSPVTHRRTITLRGSRGEVLIQDELIGRGPHRAELFLHVAPQGVVRRESENRFLLSCGKARVVVELDPCLSVDAERGRMKPVTGWASSSYHQKSPATVLVGRCDWSDSLLISMRLVLEQDVMGETLDNARFTGMIVR